MEQMMAKPVFETITERPCLSPKSWLFSALSWFFARMWVLWWEGRRRDGDEEEEKVLWPPCALVRNESVASFVHDHYSATVAAQHTHIK